jgi:hypothetical protein
VFDVPDQNTRPSWASVSNAEVLGGGSEVQTVDFQRFAPGAGKGVWDLRARMHPNAGGHTHSLFMFGPLLAPLSPIG